MLEKCVVALKTILLIQDRQIALKVLPLRFDSPPVLTYRQHVAQLVIDFVYRGGIPFDFRPSTDGIRFIYSVALQIGVIERHVLLNMLKEFGDGSQILDALLFRDAEVDV